MRRTRIALFTSGLVAVALLIGIGTVSAKTAPSRGHAPPKSPPTTAPPATTVPLPPVPPAPPGAPSAAPPVFGLTIDDISNINQIVSMEESLPSKPTTRVVFDWNSHSTYQPASYYASALKQLQAVGPTMGLLMDSSYEKGVSSATYQTMVESYLATLGSSVNVWEVGNEVNGSWTGPYATVAANLSEAYNDVAAVGAQSALTLYANEYAPNNCGDGTSELTPVQFSQQFVPASVRDGLSYVYESYYPTQCSPTTFPTDSQVQAEMVQLHALYPNALLGFGEVGLPDAAKTKTLAAAEQVMSWAYSLNPGLSYYVGGYFYWYGAEDLALTAAPLFPSFVSALNAEKLALAG